MIHIKEDERDFLFAKTFPPVQAESLTALVDVLRSVFAIRKLGGHREFQRIATGEGRACPGKGGMALVESLRKSTGLVKP